MGSSLYLSSLVPQLPKLPSIHQKSQGQRLTGGESCLFFCGFLQAQIYHSCYCGCYRRCQIFLSLGRRIPFLMASSIVYLSQAQQMLLGRKRFFPVWKLIPLDFLASIFSSFQFIHFPPTVRAIIFYRLLHHNLKQNSSKLFVTPMKTMQIRYYHLYLKVNITLKIKVKLRMDHLPDIILLERTESEFHCRLNLPCLQSQCHLPSPPCTLLLSL